MEAKKTPEEYRDALQKQIVDKANSEPEFRSQLKANPQKAITAAFGIPIESDVKVSVLEENPKQFYLVLPLQPTDELSTAELSTISGGKHSDPGSCACFCF